jgi:serine/threonine protein kinase
LRQPIPFGKYYLLERVNVGGMAEVFKAKATGVEGFERLVAVKRILPSIAEDAEFITMFIDEAKIAVQLTHANIAQIFDLGKVDDSYFIALEYIHGKDLRAIFNRGRSRGEPVPIPMACFCIMKLCEGLEYAHNKRDASGQFLNLVHRDVSPQNIIVSHEGEVKIIDFGIAKAAGKSGRTQTGILKGKFGYMSPEQVQGFEIDRRSDVFGVGICLYELLTGERLFIGETDFATLEKVRNVDIMPPSTYNRRITQDLEKIVLKALSKERGTRHQTAMQLHDDLQAFMYSSGNFFGRRDLAMYMQRAFADEIIKEDARDKEYAELGIATRDEVTGLSSFDEIEAVSSVSALQQQPYADDFDDAPARSPSPAAQQHYKAKSTLLGLPNPSPAAAPRSIPTLRAPSGPPVFGGGAGVPPLVPRVGSIPPGRSAPPGVRASVPGKAAQPNAPMEWDDEEMSTQIYDRPDEPGAGDGLRQGFAPAGRSIPATLAAQAAAHVPQMAAPPVTAHGAPSPFGASVWGTSDGTPAEPNAAWPRSAHPKATRTRSPMLVALLSVLVIVGAIVGGLWLFRNPPTGTVNLTTTPVEVSVALDGVAQVGSSPFVFSRISARTNHEIVVSKAGYRSWSLKFALDADETMQLQPVVLESLESGFSLDSRPPGASVFVDGRRLAKGTPLRVVDLEPGDHHVRIEAEGYAPWESSLHVTRGMVLDLPTAQLMARTAAPIPQPLPAPALPTRPVSAPSAQSTRVRRSTPPPREAPVAQPRPQPEQEATPAPPRERPSSGGGGTGMLRVQTRPWSKVFVDGRPVGTTPLTGLTLSAGRHTLTFVNEDFGIRKTVKIEVEAGQTLTQSLTLE